MNYYRMTGGGNGMIWKVVAFFQNEAIPLLKPEIETIGDTIIQNACKTEEGIIVLAHDADAIITQSES